MVHGHCDAVHAPSHMWPNHVHGGHCGGPVDAISLDSIPGPPHDVTLQTAHACAGSGVLHQEVGCCLSTSGYNEPQYFEC